MHGETALLERVKRRGGGGTEAKVVSGERNARLMDPKRDDFEELS